MPEPKTKKVLFLGYDRSQTVLIDFLAGQGFTVVYSNQKIASFEGYDLVVSFGYRYIIGRDAIAAATCDIVNLHMSYLPFNRGAHPNFWAFFDGTPCGVSIHLVDPGLDTGTLLFRRRVFFSHGRKTFSTTYRSLFKALERLFIESFGSIKERDWVAISDSSAGSYHRMDDLPKNFSGWDADVDHEIKKLNAQKS